MADAKNTVLFPYETLKKLSMALSKNSVSPKKKLTSSKTYF